MRRNLNCIWFICRWYAPHITYLSRERPRTDCLNSTAQPLRRRHLFVRTQNVILGIQFSKYCAMVFQRFLLRACERNESIQTTCLWHNCFVYVSTPGYAEFTANTINGSVRIVLALYRWNFHTCKLFFREECRDKAHISPRMWRWFLLWSFCVTLICAVAFNLYFCHKVSLAFLSTMIWLMNSVYLHVTFGLTGSGAVVCLSIFLVLNLTHEQRSCFKKSVTRQLDGGEVNEDICISYWPSARAALGEYRPEVLAVARSVQKSKKRPRADILPVRSRASSRLKRNFNYFINITFCGMMWRIKKLPATDWRPSKCFGDKNDFSN